VARLRTELTDTQRRLAELETAVRRLQEERR